MAEVDISPLAKRLAEENNVDWRALNGSGDDGRIVERDVLDFLARVMAGDEAADPTPEPLPDGMESWSDAPATDIGGGSWSASAEPADMAPDAPSSSTSAGHGAPAPVTAGDDDLLEVDTSDPQAQPEAANPADDWSSGTWSGNDWGADSGSDTTASNRAGSNGNASQDVFAGVSEFGTGEVSTGEGDGFDFGDDDGSFDFGNEAGSGSYGFGGEGSQENSGIDLETGPAGKDHDFDFGAGGESEDHSSFGSSAAAEDVSVFDTSSLEPAIDEGIFVFDDEPVTGQVEAEAADAGAVGPGPVDAGGMDAGQVDAGQVDSGQVDAGQFDTGPVAAGQVEAGQFDTGHAPWEGHSALAVEGEQEVADAEGLPGGDAWQQAEESRAGPPVAAAHRMSVAEDDGAVAQALTGSSEGSFEAATATTEEFDYLDAGDDALPEGVRIEEDEYRVVRSGAYGASSAATAVATTAAAVTAAPTGRGVVTAGIVLRRDVDMAPVIDARQALAAELSEEAPLVAFLLRAAVRAGRPWPLAQDSAGVGLANLSDAGVSVSVVPAAGEMPFRDLVGACAPGVEAAGEPAIAVADVSTLGIDEAVLDVGMPVLTIGRVLQDGGRLHATLTLSGLSTPEAGSKFLGRVVELLSAPVRLVL